MNITAIYVLWLREMKRFVRAKSRILGMLVMPLLFLGFLGIGFNRMPVPGIPNTSYIQFLVPGIIGMAMLFSSTFAGLSVLWDREFGFLKEIMVSPVDRISIVVGRVVGGITTALIQAILILAVSVVMGFRISVASLPLAVVFMVLIASSFIGLGLIFASVLEDMQGFGIIMNMIIFPLFFLSGALYPIENFPGWVQILSYIDPLTYGVDGLRGALIGVTSFPIITDFIVLVAFSVALVFAGTYLFERREMV